MSAMIIHGIRPGPDLWQSNPQILHAVFGGLITATVIMTVLGYLMIRPSVWLAGLSREAVVVGTLVLCVFGAYAQNQSMFDVYVAIIFGLVGYLMRQYGYAIAPTVLGFILGGLAEQNLRRGLLMTRGSVLTFFTRPITLGILIFIALGSVGMYFTKRNRERAILEDLAAKGVALDDPEEEKAQ